MEPLPVVPDVRPIVLINVFTVRPEDQQRLCDLLMRATAGVRRAPGFLSARLHRGLDGRRVTMVAQWRSAGDYEAMRGAAGPRPFLEEALTFASFAPGMYEAVQDFRPG